MKITEIMTLFLVSTLTANLNGQCTSTGANSPTSAANNVSIGSVPWGGTGNTTTSNNSRATATSLILGDVSNYLVCTGFNFDIPTTAVICGVRVEIEKSGAGLLQSVQDHSIRLTQGGLISGNNYAVGGNWPTTDTYFSYGGPANLWGLALTPAMISSPTFGVAISANLSGSLILPSARIDHVRITVFYDNSLPIELLNFTADRNENNSVQINWTTKSEINNSFFTIERSTDTKSWNEIGQEHGAGNSSSILSYSFIDYNPQTTETYYRLKQTDFDGNFSYSDIVSVPPLMNDADLFTVYPNPSNGVFSLYVNQEHSLVEIYSLSGTLVYKNQLTENSTQLDLSELHKGIYLVKVQTKYAVLTQKIILE